LPAISYPGQYPAPFPNFADLTVSTKQRSSFPIQAGKDDLQDLKQMIDSSQELIA